MAAKSKIKNWEKLADDEILQMRIRDLGLQIAGSPIEPLIKNLYDELDNRNINFHPQCYLADEWLCPDKTPIIGIPFWLANTRLKHIEQKMMFQAEGGTTRSFMKLLRHECGHAINYAYQFYKRTRWRELFGPFSTKYTNSYYYRPYSKRYVIHLEGNYAQSHPDEDFAETFAVWLTPNSNWKEKYLGWPVIKKLQYVDRTMKRISQRSPLPATSSRPPWAASRMTSTLDAYYQRKRKLLGTEFQGYYDDSLRKILDDANITSSNVKAFKLLQQYRRQLVNNISLWTGHRKYDIHQLTNKIITRCKKLDLYAKTDHTSTLIEITSLIAVIASNTLRFAVRHGKK